MNEAVRWNIKVSADADRSVRGCLAQRGMKKGDLSRFVEEAVQWRVFRMTVDQAREATSDLDRGELERVISEAVEAARAEKHYEPAEISSVLNIRLPEQLERQLAEEARRSDRSRSEVARDALAFYLRIHRRRRYIERLKRAAALLAEAEARALADEALPLDDEALAVAEAPATYGDNADKWWA